MIFYFNHFSLIIFYHSVWLGFELFGLRVQVHRTRHSLRSRAKDMTVTIVIINHRQEMRLEWGWRHAQKRWAENLEDFWKRFSRVPTMVLRSWGPTMVLRSWGPTKELRIWDWAMQVDNWVSVIGQRMEFSAIELSFLPLRRRLIFSGPDQRRWIEI